MDLPKSDERVFFVHLSGDRLYTEADKTLYVYSVSDLTLPICTYPLDGRLFSVIIIDDCLYLGGNFELIAFKVSSSIYHPLIYFKVI